MQSYIQHVIEPKRLLLAWQAPEGPQRTRYIVAELVREDGNSQNTVLLRYLRGSEDFKNAWALGFRGHPAFMKAEKDYAVGVVDALMRRLPPRTRGDFSRYLELLCIRPETQISDFALLGYSGARLPSDGFSLIHPFEGVEGPCEFLMEVAGFRYMTNVSIRDITIGSTVSFVKEPSNKVDTRAVKVMLRDKAIGYVNRGQLSAFHRWIDEQRLHGIVERINGTDSRPLIYVFVRVLAKESTANDLRAIAGR